MRVGGLVFEKVLLHGPEENMGQGDEWSMVLIDAVNLQILLCASIVALL